MKKLLTKFNLFVMSLLTISLLTFSVAAPAEAVNVFPACNGSSSTVCSGTKDNIFTFWSRIINTLLFFVGTVAVVMIIVGGIRYAVSNGDQSAITGAKNTILYAVVGLVIAIMSFAIVNFVLSRLGA